MSICRHKCFNYDICFMADKSLIESAERNGFCGKFLDKERVVILSECRPADIKEVFAEEKNRWERKAKALEERIYQLEKSNKNWRRKCQRLRAKEKSDESKSNCQNIKQPQNAD